MFSQATDLITNHFGVADPALLRWEKIERGGSDRDFWRVIVPGTGQSAIVISYGTTRAENARYVRVAEFLTAHGVRVPQVWLHDADQRVVVLEDFGQRDLWSARDEPWAVRRPLYEATLREVHRMHGLTAAIAEAEGVSLEQTFDEALYRWEQDYFFAHCLGAALADRVDPARVAAVHSLPVWVALAEELAAPPRVLVHRDFQSQNILLLTDGRAGLIDFQGMRAGLPHYDLASLLHDPYVSLAPDERREMLAFYRTLDPGVTISERLFHLCSAQRLMQALGAYGFLGLQRGKPAFLQHIPRALASLRGVAANVGELAPLAELLGGIKAASL